MKRPILLAPLAALAFVAFVLASPALAQTAYLHGGASFPSSSAFNTAYKTGFDGGLGVGIPITSQLEGVIRGSYGRFGLDIDGADNNFSSYSGTANLKLNGPWMNRRFMPYALGGAGLFRMGVKNAFETDFGFQAGAGMAVRTSSRINLMIEPNYIVVLNEGENTQYFPIRLGAAFAL